MKRKSSVFIVLFLFTAIFLNNCKFAPIYINKTNYGAFYFSQADELSYEENTQFVYFGAEINQKVRRRSNTSQDNYDLFFSAWVYPETENKEVHTSPVFSNQSPENGVTGFAAHQKAGVFCKEKMLGVYSTGDGTSNISELIYNEWNWIEWDFVNDDSCNISVDDSSTLSVDHANFGISENPFLIGAAIDTADLFPEESGNGTGYVLESTRNNIGIGFTGYIADVTIRKNGDSGEKILAQWPLDEGSGQNVYDSSGNGYDGVLGRNTDVGTDDPSWEVMAGPEGSDRAVLHFTNPID